MEPTDGSLVNASRSVEFAGDLVYKRFSGDVDAEYEKARLLWELSQEFDFLFPEPITLRRSDKVIVSRNLNLHGELVSVREAYLRYVTDSRRSVESLKVVQDAGRVLGTIHRELKLAAATRWRPSDTYLEGLGRWGASRGQSWQREEEQVYLHDDYGFSNVFYLEDSGFIATLDPSPDGYSTFATALRGSRYVDLGQFSSCLEGRVPLRWYPRAKWRRLDQLRSSFLDGYEETSAVTVDRERVRHFGFATAEAYFRRTQRSRPMSWLAGRVLFNPLKGNMPPHVDD